MATPFDQSTYQVRMEWGVAGLSRLAPADVIVIVDVLRFTSTVTRIIADGGTVAFDDDAFAVSINGAAVADHASNVTDSIVLAGCLRNASAVADEIVRIQHERAARTSITIIAAGERESRDAGAPVRFAVEDALGAGAIIAALGDRGIDHTAPDAAFAAEAFRALRGAVRHLLTASGSGRELTERGQGDEVVAAAQLDADTAVPRLTDGTFA